MLEQATKKNNNSDLEEMIKNQKMFLNFTIHNIFLELTSLSIPYIIDADIASKISLFLTGVFSVFLVEEAAFFKLSRNKISELKKYAIYLEKKKEIDEYMSSDIETFNINKLDNYSLEDLRLIKKELDGIKVLGNGELTKKLTVVATKFSKSAQEKIQAVGGKIEVK